MIRNTLATSLQSTKGMEADYTEKTSGKSAQVPSTERVSLGRRCELAAEAYYEQNGIKTLEKNIRFEIGEIDLFAFDRARRRYILIEVRSRKSRRFRPRDMLSRAKKRRLLLLQRIMQAKVSLPVHIELCEVRVEGSKTFITRVAVDAIGC